MEKVIQVLNQMLADGIIERFAIGRGIAAIYYLPPYHTDDIDVFFLPVLVTENGLVSLEPIYSYLAKLGYYPIKEGVLIEDWPVQFVAPFKSVQEEAIIKARQVTYGNTETLIFSRRAPRRRASPIRSTEGSLSSDQFGSRKKIGHGSFSRHRPQTRPS